MVPINRPVGTGIAIAIAIAVVVVYAVCTPARLSASGAFLSFIDALCNGMDLSSIARPRPFNWPRFLVALVVLGGWTLAAGDVPRRPFETPDALTTSRLLE